MFDQATSRATILIVDDTPLNIRILVEALKADYRLLVANSGARALQAVQLDKPDLILLDIMMPEMDGYEVCSRLKQDPSTMGIPIIFITAKGEHEDEARGLELGAVDYITKPIHLSILRARVRTHVTLKRKTDLLEHLAAIDGLTDIPNRRYFDTTLDREWRRCQRSGSSLALIMLDVDCFKLYNDNYGHAGGDMVLQQVARTMSRVARRGSDTAARYGGEEFAVILGDTGLEGGMEIAEQIRSGVQALAIPHAHSPASSMVTVSLGVASMVPTSSQTMQELIVLADQALYRAKEGGRNQVRGEVPPTGSEG